MVNRHCPDMARWVYWCLDGSSRVHYNAHVLDCTTAIIEKLMAIPQLRQLWFLDDGILRGKSTQVLKTICSSNVEGAAALQGQLTASLTVD